MNQEYWDRARDFHGHECPGLAIGVRACEAAVERMGISPAFDEELLCITENDACGVDAVQALMSCTIGKGNLIYRPTGKQAFTFISRSSGKAMRFYFKADRGEMQRGEYILHILTAPTDTVFSCKTVDIPLPERARIFTSRACEKCGEAAAEHMLRIQNGQLVCLDCYEEYTRGW